LGEDVTGSSSIRRRMGAAAAVAVTGVAMAAMPALGQQSPPEAGAINNGTAKATAVVSKVGPGVGNLELAMTGGIAVTEVTNSVAQSTAQTLDMGLIGTSLTDESCRGSQTLTPDDLPQPTSVDNRDGDARAQRDESGTAGGPAALGRMDVHAADGPPEASASTTTQALQLDPVVQIGSGRASARTAVLPGEGRQAEAEVTSSLDLAGALSLEGMRWSAFHRTGREPLAEASFDVGRAAIGGLPFPTQDLAALEAAANQVLEPLGATIALPRVERFLEPNDLVRVTPMRIEVRDSPAGKTVFGPLLDATRDGRGQAFDALVEQVCDTASMLLVGDVVLSIVSGTGFLVIEVGGAEAMSSDFVIGDPFGAPVPPAVATPMPPTPATAPTAAVATTTAPPTPGTAAPPTEQALPALQPTSAMDRVCESVHPNGGTCRDGAAATVGLLAVLVTTGIAGADLLRQRRGGGAS
jgi:hypothetical protein